MIDLYHKVVEEVRHYGHSSISVEQVAEIHKLLGAKQKPDDYLGQTIAWSLWHHLHDDDPREEKLATAVLWSVIPCLILDSAFSYRRSMVPMVIVLVTGALTAFLFRRRK